MRVKKIVLALMLAAFSVSASAKVVAVHSPTELPGTSIDLSQVGPSRTSVPSGSSFQGVTIITETQNPLEIFTQCVPPAYTAPAGCGWIGNFAPTNGPDAYVLWSSGYYNSSNQWLGNAPITISFLKPVTGVGFAVMADEGGKFTGTISAYSKQGKFLGSFYFTGNNTDPTAVFVGLKSSNNDISKIVVDVSGLLYAHDFGISNIVVGKSKENEDSD
jgi:hypothetical protein